MPDLARQLHLDALLDTSYVPHRGASYNQSYVTPGTIDPEIPTLVQSEDQPETQRMERALQEHRNLNSLMDMLFDVVHRPGYETMGPFTIGGKSQAALSQIANVTGVGSVYTLANTFDSDAEYCVLAAHFGAAGQAVLSKDPSNPGPGLTQQYDGTALVRVMPFYASSVVTLTYGSDYWFPIPASDSLYWSVNMATPNTDSALVTVAFRRRITRHGRYFLTQE
jgi:hypothetical protein